MKTKHILTALLCIIFASNVDAQILKKLRKKAEQAAERALLKKTDEIVTKKTEKTIDDATSKKDKNDASEKQSDNVSNNTAIELNTEAKQDFYIEDLVIEMFENNVQTQTQYFDKDEVAVKMVSKNIVKPGYTDSEGFIYVFDEKKGQYSKSSIIALQSQGMMMPTMMLEAFKLPPEPFMASLQKQQDQGVTPNPFNGIVEFAFIYEPENFRYEDFKESKQTINGKIYTKFDFLNEPGYEGSYVLFDNQDRLVEIYTKTTASENNMETFEMGRQAGEARFKYTYQPVDVELPDAIEVKMAGQGLMEMVMGSNKKSKNPEDIDEDDYDTSDSKGMTKSIKKSLKNNKVTAEMLPESYDFDYIYRTTFVQDSKKGGTTMDMNFLINTKNANYNGAEYLFENKKNEGNTKMIFDLDLMVMVMFMEYGDQKMLQLYPIPEVKNTNTKADFTIKELPPKTILGFACIGLQLENEDYIMTAYHAKNAPISLSNFFGFGGSKGSKDLNLPDMDPRLLKQFENSLVMEMQYEDKKRKKNNFIITAKSLEKDPETIAVKDYKSMNMLSGGNLFKN